jgi:streptogramin lyase
MNTENKRFKRAIDEAYAKQVGKQADSWEGRQRIMSLGRRRRALRISGAAVLVALTVVGASTTVGAFRQDRNRLAGRDVPAIGSERVMDFGGPIAATGDSLFVANGYSSNDAGDKESIARLDLDTRKVTNTDPTSLATAQSVSMGSAGLWMVSWSGDLPLGDDQDRARGVIQLVDPRSGEVILDIPREGSAPFDVAAGERDGRAVGYVVDAGTHQLLEVDANSGTIETTELDIRPDIMPNEVIFDDGIVWITGNASGEGALMRFDPESGTLDEYDVDHCMNDLVAFEGSLWVTDFCGKAVHRFDPTAGQWLATVPLETHTGAITVADGFVWVQRESDIVRVDPTTDEIVGDPIYIDEFGFADANMVPARDGVYVSTIEGVYRLAEGLPQREPEPKRSPTPEETKNPMSSRSCSAEGVMCIPLDRGFSVAGAGFGSAWVGNVGEGDTFGTARFDAQSGEEIARLRTEGFVIDFAPDERWMWALVEEGFQLTLLKIDPETTTVVDSFDLGDPGNIGKASIVAGGGYVWVSQPKGAVARISAEDGDISTYSYGSDLPGFGDSNGPLHLAYGEDSLLLSYGAGHLGVVEPSSGELTRIDEDALGVNAYEIVVAGRSVWSPHQTVEGDNVLSYASISGEGDQGLVRLVENFPPGLAAADGEHVWVLQSSPDEEASGRLVDVDANTMEIVGEPLEVDTRFEGGVAVGDGFVWVTGDSVLYRVEIAG